MTTSIDILPPEIMDLIIHYVQLPMRLLLVCRLWHQIIYNSSHYRDLLGYKRINSQLVYKSLVLTKSMFVEKFRDILIRGFESSKFCIDRYSSNSYYDIILYLDKRYTLSVKFSSKMSFIVARDEHNNQVTIWKSDHNLLTKRNYFQEGFIDDYFPRETIANVNKAMIGTNYVTLYLAAKIEYVSSLTKYVK